jgi:SNF2 family DNA or RNA helicase
MGLGKTVSALTAFQDLKEERKVRHALVVAPLRVSRKVWPDEIQNWSHLGGLSISCMHGAVADRFQAMRTYADIHTINRENLAWLIDQFVFEKKPLMRWPWDMVILDESQSFRSQSSERWKSIRRARKWIKRMVHLTGTPIPAGYHNLWAQWKLLDRGVRLGDTEDAFKKRWYEPASAYEYAPKIKPGAADEIWRRIADWSLSLQAEDYLDLKPVMNNAVRVQLTPAQRKVYERMERQYIAELNGKVVTAVNAGVCAGKLLQLANGAIYVDDKGNFEHFHDHKLDALMEVLESTQGPALIGYAYRSDKQRIAAALDKFCGKRRVWRMLKTTQDEDAWNAGLVDYMMIHPKSAGHGLNLQHSGAETLIWFGLTHNLEDYQQLNARLFGGHRRRGNNMVIHHIVCDETKDDHAMSTLSRREVDQRYLLKALTRT